MSGLGVTVLPKDDSLERALMQVVAGWQQRRSEDRQLAQQESQFARSHGLDEQRTTSLVDTNKANVENASLQTLSQRADAISKGLLETADGLAKKGAKPEQIQNFIVEAMKNFADDPAKPQPVRDLFSEVRSRLVPVFTAQPDTPGGQMVRGALETGAAATERAAAGSQNPIDVNWAMKASTGEQLTAPAFGYQDTAEQGPEAVRAAVAIADDRTAGATPQLQARTQQSIAANNNATQLQIAREGDANARAIAGMRTDGKAPTGAGGREERNANFAADGVALIDDLLNHPGFSGAVGAKGLSSMFGMFDEPIGGTDAAGFAAKLERLRSLTTLPNLEMMRGLGAMSEKEMELVRASAGALSRNISEAEFKEELKRMRPVLEKASKALAFAERLGLRSPVGAITPDDSDPLGLFK